MIYLIAGAKVPFSAQAAPVGAEAFGAILTSVIEVAAGREKSIRPIRAGKGIEASTLHSRQERRGGSAMKGEAVGIVVKKNDSLDAGDVIAHCRKFLVGYKSPRRAPGDGFAACARREAKKKRLAGKAHRPVGARF